jgi:hypothetical protein
VGDIEDTFRARGYRHVWVVDTEYCPFDNHPRARCLCAVDLLSGERREVWLAGVGRPPCPFEMTSDESFVFWAADADVNLFITLGFPIPRNVIDVLVEFRRIHNGLASLPPEEGGNPDIAAKKEAKAARSRFKKPGPFSLARVARHYGVPIVSDEDKGKFRDLAARISNEFDPEEQTGMIFYCRGDADATAGVLRAIWADTGLSDPRTFDQALFRGYSMSAYAWTQYLGIPTDLPLYRRFALAVPALCAMLIAEHAAEFDLYEGRHFNHDKFAIWLDDRELLTNWPRTSKDKFATSDEAFQQVIDGLVDNEQLQKQVEGLAKFLESIKLLEGIGSSFDKAGEIAWGDDAKGLHICPDGRSRASLIPFATKTSRPAPGGRKFLFTNSHWMRFLMRPSEGRAVLHFDYTAQEPHIAAARSHDPALMELCEHADPHVRMAIDFGLAPPGATQQTHRAARKVGKVFGLAVLYGGTARMINALTKVGRGLARDFHLRLKAKFAVYYQWSDRFAYLGLCAMPLYSPLGWRFWPRYWEPGEEPDRTCRNFPVQATAADMARLVLVRALEARLAVVAVIHDAFVVECAVADVERVKEVFGKILTEAAIDIIGKPIPFTCDVTCHPERSYDKDGAEDFEKLMSMLDEAERRQRVAD